MKFRLSFLIITLVLFMSCSQVGEKKAGLVKSQEENLNSGVPVIVSQIDSLQKNSQLVFSGSVEAQTTDIGFMASDKVAKVLVQEGSPVKKGQLVALLDATNYQLNADIANAGRAQTQDEYNRLTIMYNRGSLPPADYEKIKTALQQAKTQQALAEKSVANTKLFAPVSGIIAKRETNPGEIAGQGIPLFSIVEIDPAQVRVAVPESELSQVKLGQKTPVFIPALNDTLNGKISSISPVADPATRAYTIIINIPNPQMLVRPGMIAQANIASSRLSPVVVVPGEAVIHNNDGTNSVFVVDTRRGKAFKRKVIIGNLYDNNIEVVSGLNVGEQIVTGGQQKLTDGTTVQIKASL